jgi:hypothetical protein
VLWFLLTPAWRVPTFRYLFDAITLEPTRNLVALNLMLCFLLAAPGYPAPQAPPKPASPALDQVIDAYHQAVGGKALDAVSSWELLAHPLDQKLTSLSHIRITLYWKAPNKVHRVNKGAFSVSELAFDGQAGWILMQHGKSHRINADKLDQLNTVCNPVRFVHLADIYPGSVVEGPGNVNGREVMVVLATLNWGERRFSFDAESHLLLQFEDRFKSGDKPRFTRFGEYEETGGVRLPREIQIESLEEPGVLGVRIEKVRLNVPIKDVSFENPR